MRDWYYMEGEERRGPVAEADVRTLLRAQRLPADAFVWAEGMEDWVPASEVPELVHGGGDTLEDAISGPQERPWVRYWARLLDIFLAGAVLGVAYEPLVDLPDLLFATVLSFVWMFAEVALLTTWGTTPGKALLRVRVRGASGGKPSARAALVRYLNMWMRGQGFNVPLINIATHLAAYMTLTSQGSTSWDRIADTVVLHQRVGIVRTAVTILLVIVMVMLTVWSTTEIGV